MNLPTSLVDEATFNRLKFQVPSNSSMNQQLHQTSYHNVTRLKTKFLKVLGKIVVPDVIADKSMHICTFENLQWKAKQLQRHKS